MSKMKSLWLFLGWVSDMPHSEYAMPAPSKLKDEVKEIVPDLPACSSGLFGQKLIMRGIHKLFLKLIILFCHTERGKYMPTSLSWDVINSHWFNHCWDVCKVGIEWGKEERGPSSRQPFMILSNHKFFSLVVTKRLGYRIMFVHLFFPAVNNETFYIQSREYGLSCQDSRLFHSLQ